MIIFRLLISFCSNRNLLKLYVHLPNFQTYEKLTVAISMLSWERTVSLTLSFLYLHFVKSANLLPFCVSISRIHRVCAEIQFQQLYISPLFCLLQTFSSFPEVWLKSFFFFFKFHLSYCLMSLEKVCGQFFRAVTPWVQDSWSSFSPFPASLNLDPSELFGKLLKVCK